MSIIRIASYREARSNQSHYDYVVSISGPLTPEEQLGVRDWGRRPESHLILAFDDYRSKERYPGVGVLPETKHIRRLLEWFASVPPDAPVLVHCSAGISRSSAIAYILQCVRMGPGSEKEALLILNFYLHDPNPWLIEMGDHMLNRDGRMIKAIQDWKIEWNQSPQ